MARGRRLDDLAQGADAGTGTSVLPKSRVIARITVPSPRRRRRAAPRAISTATGFAVHEQPAPAEARGGDARSCPLPAYGSRTRSPGPARRRDDPLEQPDRLLGRVARSAPRSPAARSSSTTRRSAACRAPPSPGPTSPGARYGIRSIASRSNSPRVALRVPQDRVVLARPAVARAPAVVVRPDELVEEPLRPEHLVEQQPDVVDRPPVARGGRASRAARGRGGSPRTRARERGEVLVERQPVVPGEVATRPRSGTRGRRNPRRVCVAAPGPDRAPGAAARPSRTAGRRSARSTDAVGQRARSVEVVRLDHRARRASPASDGARSPRASASASGGHRVSATALDGQISRNAQKLHDR